MNRERLLEIGGSLLAGLAEALADSLRARAARLGTHGDARRLGRLLAEDVLAGPVPDETPRTIVVVPERTHGPGEPR